MAPESKAASTGTLKASLSAMLLIALPYSAFAQSSRAGDFTVAYGAKFIDQSSDSATTVPSTLTLPLAAVAYLNPAINVHVGADSLVSVRAPGVSRSTGFAIRS